MILAEKFSQKLNNLKSKNEIQDFFIYFDEYKSLYLKTINGKIGKSHSPTQYGELSEGEYLIVWPNNKMSTGHITTSSVGSFDEFISNAKRSARTSSHEVYIPERGIYPMVRTYSKALADMIDVPEYILKLTDILDEIDRMVAFSDGEGEVTIRDGVRYAYSSRNLDEYFSYTTFSLRKVFRNHFTWQLEASDIPSIMSFQELFSFLGDIYNYQTKSKHKDIKAGQYDIVLPPHIFWKIFEDQIINSINGDLVLRGKSLFPIEAFKNKLKALGSLSVSYDPLLVQKKGSYKFTKFGLKPQKQYFIRYGKLDTPILNAVNYSELGYKSPTIDIEDRSNIKIEGLKKKTFSDLKKSGKDFIFLPDALSITKKNKVQQHIYTSEGIQFDSDKNVFVTPRFSLDLNLIDLIREGRVELVEFIDGQTGIQILGQKILPIK